MEALLFASNVALLVSFLVERPTAARRFCSLSNCGAFVYFAHASLLQPALWTLFYALTNTGLLLLDHWRRRAKVQLKTSDYVLAATIAKLPAGLTDDQVERLGLYKTRNGALRALQRLDRCGLVTSSKVNVRRLKVTGPVFRSAEGQPLRSGKLEDTLRVRLNGVRPSLVRVWHHHRLDLSKAEHDVMLAEVFLHFRSSRPDLSWISEAELAAMHGARGHEQPDAALSTSGGTIVTYVDWVGTYRAPRIEALVHYSNSQNVPIELF